MLSTKLFSFHPSFITDLHRRSETFSPKVNARKIDKRFASLKRRTNFWPRLCMKHQDEYCLRKSCHKIKTKKYKKHVITNEWKKFSLKRLAIKEILAIFDCSQADKSSSHPTNETLSTITNLQNFHYNNVNNYLMRMFNIMFSLGKLAKLYTFDTTTNKKFSLFEFQLFSHI